MLRHCPLLSNISVKVGFNFLFGYQRAKEKFLSSSQDKHRWDLGELAAAAN